MDQAKRPDGMALKIVLKIKHCQTFPNPVNKDSIPTKQKGSVDWRKQHGAIYTAAN